MEEYFYLKKKPQLLRDYNFPPIILQTLKQTKSSPSSSYYQHI